MTLHHHSSLRVAILADDLAAIPQLCDRLAALDIAVVVTAATESSPTFEPTQIDVRVVLLPASLPAPAACGFRDDKQPPVFALHPTIALYRLVVATDLGVTGHALVGTADRDLVIGLQAVARGCLFFCSALSGAIRQLYRAQIDKLTDDDVQLIAMVSTGQTNSTIAKALGLTEKIIEYRLRQICARLGLNNKIELGVWWGRRLEYLYQRCPTAYADNIPTAPLNRRSTQELDP